MSEAAEAARAATAATAAAHITAGGSGDVDVVASGHSPLVAMTAAAMVTAELAGAEREQRDRDLGRIEIPVVEGSESLFVFHSARNLW